MNKNIFILALIAISLSFIGCNADDPEDGTFALITLNKITTQGDIAGSFTGYSGSFVETYTWQNSKNSMDYRANITSNTNGVFNMMVEDANGNVVLDRLLNGDESSDFLVGTSFGGVPGEWTVTITLSEFTGDGSFFLNEGN